MNKHLRPIHQRERGIFLIELLVGIALISLAFAAFVDLIVRQIQATRLAQQEIVAAKLATNAFEFVKNKKDNHVSCTLDPGCPLFGADWKTNLTRDLSPPVPLDSPIQFEIDETDIDQLLPDQEFEQLGGSPRVHCVARTGPQRFRGRYRPCSGGDENLRGGFTRVVTLREIPGRFDIIDVEVVVEWSGGNSINLNAIIAYDQT